MSNKHIVVEAIIPSTGDPMADHEITAAISEAVAALKKAVHGLPNPGTVEVRHRTMKTKTIPTTPPSQSAPEDAKVEVPPVVTERTGRHQSASQAAE